MSRWMGFLKLPGVTVINEADGGTLLEGGVAVFHALPIRQKSLSRSRELKERSMQWTSQYD